MIRDDGENRGNVRAMAVFAALGLGAAGLGARSALAGSAVSETVLYSCCQQTNCTDGQLPLGGLIATTQGALYGTTYRGGGKADAGVAFLVTVTGGYSLVHSFQGTSMDGGSFATRVVISLGRPFSAAGLTSARSLSRDL